jgi:hypothetical protein
LKCTITYNGGNSCGVYPVSLLHVLILCSGDTSPVPVQCLKLLNFDCIPIILTGTVDLCWARHGTISLMCSVRWIMSKQHWDRTGLEVTEARCSNTDMKQELEGYCPCAGPD